MLPPLYVRPFSDAEQAALKQGLRSKDAFTLRRCQILLASAKRNRPKEIATHIGCSVQTVRNTIRAFEQQGLACLQAESSRPKTVKPIFNEGKRAQLRYLLRHRHLPFSVHQHNLAWLATCSMVKSNLG